MKRYLLFIIFFTCTSCLHMNMPPEIIVSPVRLYRLKTEVNKNTNDTLNYQCVTLTLYDSTYKALDSVKTRASNYSKWAVGWYPTKDTIILNSHDVGTLAYHIANQKTLEQIPVSKDIEKTATVIFEKKYKN